MIIKEPFNGIWFGEDPERETKEYMEVLMRYTNGKPYEPETTIKERITIPEGYDITAAELRLIPDAAKREKIKEFWASVRKKMEVGEGEVCGLQWGYFNFARMRGGKASKPDYRRNDNQFYFLTEACKYGDNKHFKGYFKKGIIEIGRRRSGKSTKIGFMVVEFSRRKRDIDIIITSKTEEDAQRVIIGEKVQHIHNNLPYPIKPAVLAQTKGVLHLGRKAKDAAGNPIMRGKNNKILGKTPKSVAIEGSTLDAWIHDEGPKTDNFYSLFVNTIEALNDEEGLDRDGFVYTTGVAGDFGVHGDDYIKIWNAADAYQMVRWFSAGWYGLDCDEYGNENIEKAVRRILERRHLIHKNPTLTRGQKDEAIMKEMQKFPLTVQEALQSSGETMFDIQKVEAQKTIVGAIRNKIEMYAKLEWVIDKKTSRIIPDGNGELMLLEVPKPESHYLIGADAVGVKNFTKGSRGVAVVWKCDNVQLSPMERDALFMKLNNEPDPEERLKLYLQLGGLPIGILNCGLRHPKDYADKVAMLAKWIQRITGHEKAPLTLVETEPSNMIDYLRDHFMDILAYQPIRHDRPPTLTEYNLKGIATKGYWAEKRRETLVHIMDVLIDRLFIWEILDKALTYNDEIQEKKHDELDALGIVGLLKNDFRVKDMLTRARKPTEEMSYKRFLTSYRRTPA